MKLRRYRINYKYSFDENLLNRKYLSKYQCHCYYYIEELCWVKLFWEIKLPYREILLDENDKVVTFNTYKEAEKFVEKLDR